MRTRFSDSVFCGLTVSPTSRIKLLNNFYEKTKKKKKKKKKKKRKNVSSSVAFFLSLVFSSTDKINLGIHLFAS